MKRYNVPDLIWTYQKELIGLPVIGPGDTADSLYIVIGVNKTRGLKVLDLTTYFTPLEELYIPLDSSVSVVKISNIVLGKTRYLTTLEELEVDNEKITELIKRLTEN